MTSTTLRPGRTTALAIALLTTTVVAGLTQSTARADEPTPSRASERVVLDVTGSLATIGDAVDALDDIDARGSTLPTLAQRRAVSALGVVDVRWNRLGTPASLLPRDGVLARATSSDPGVAARRWLADNADVFGLTVAQVDELELVNEQELAYSPARAVLFRQNLGGLVPAVGSMVTVGVANGEIAYASSSISKSTQAPPAGAAHSAAGLAEGGNQRRTRSRPGRRRQDQLQGRRRLDPARRPRPRPAAAGAPARARHG